MTCTGETRRSACSLRCPRAVTSEGREPRARRIESGGLCESDAAVTGALELAGAPLYAVHPQQQIQQGADQRHQPYQAGPGRGGAGIPFVLRHMQRHPDRRDHAGGTFPGPEDDATAGE